MGQTPPSRKNRRWVVTHYYGVDQGRGWDLRPRASLAPGVVLLGGNPATARLGRAGEASLAEIDLFLAADLAIAILVDPWNKIGMPWLRDAYAMEAQAIEQGTI